MTKHLRSLLSLNYRRRKPITNIRDNSLTFSELYHLEMAERKLKIASKTIKGYDCSFKHCSSLHNMRITDIKVSHLQSCIKSRLDIWKRLRENQK